VINKTCVLALMGTMVATASSVHGQTRDWTERGYIGVNLGVQPQSRTFTETAYPVVYGEQATVTVPHIIPNGLVFDASGAMRVWENFGVGIGYSRFSSTETATFTALVPNPVVFGAPRPTSGAIGGVAHSEDAVHIQLLWMFPVSPALHVAAIIGPSFITVGQDLVSGITPTEGPPPFTTVASTTVQTESQSKTTVAVTFGTDLAYYFSQRAGVGGFVRYSRASGGNVDLLSPTGTGKVSVEAGGVQLGFGFRVRF
jgi:hypothetical protein